MSKILCVLEAIILRTQTDDLLRLSGGYALVSYFKVPRKN